MTGLSGSGIFLTVRSSLLRTHPLIPQMALSSEVQDTAAAWDLSRVLRKPLAMQLESGA